MAKTQSASLLHGPSIETVSHLPAVHRAPTGSVQCEAGHWLQPWLHDAGTGSLLMSADAHGSLSTQSRLSALPQSVRVQQPLFPNTLAITQSSTVLQAVLLPAPPAAVPALPALLAVPALPAVSALPPLAVPPLLAAPPLLEPVPAWFELPPLEVSVPALPAAALLFEALPPPQACTVNRARPTPKSDE